MKKLLLLMLAISAGISSWSAAINVTSDQGHYIVTSASSDCAPVVTTFDQVVNYPGAVYVKYHYGDGVVSGALSINATPTHTYTFAGEYDSYSEYINGAGVTIGYEYARIEIFGDPSGLYSQQTAACPNDLVTFYLNMGWSSGPVNSYSWNFGDGNTETSDWYSISHKFSAPGSYNVSVTVTGPCGTYVENMVFTVGTNVPFSGGYFSHWGDPICPHEEVGFSFPNVYAQYLLTFGDNTFTTSDYYHTYNNAGTYVASITLTNGCGNSGTYYDTVHVQNGIGFNPNYPIYVYNSSPACPGQEVNFDTYSSYYQVEWQFSDGTSSTNFWVKKEINSTVDDTVYVTVTNGCGFDTTVMSIVDIVTNLPVDEINLTVTDSVCTGSQFPYLSNGFSDPETDYTYHWDFGDGNSASNPNGSYAYNTNGTYTLSLTITNGCGVDSTQTAQIYVGPGVAPDPNMQFMFPVPEDGSCPGDTALIVIFPYVPGAYNLDFGDGNNSSAIASVHLLGNDYGLFKHAYNTAGNYTLTLTYTNSCGLSYSKTAPYTISSGTQATNNGLLYDQSLNICLGEPISFYAYGGATYQWDFGDGSGTLITYNTFVPVDHVYQNPGVYTVHLKITNGCGNTSVVDENIVIPDNRINIVTNTIDANCHMADGEAIAVINGGKPPYNIYWSNGATGILVDSLAAGIYVVNVSDANGCYNFDIATVSDAQAPAIVLNTVVDVTCNGGNDGALDINVIGNSGPYYYSWSNGAHSEDQSGLVAGPYELYVTDANGCIATGSYDVDEPDPVQVSFSITKPSCSMSNGKVTANALGNSGPFTYVWSNGQNGPTLNNIPAGIYTVNVIDQKGCIITKSVAVSGDNGMGGPVIALNSISPLDCNGSGSTIDISVYFAPNPTYQWSNGATTQDVTVTQAGTYTVHVVSNGCNAYEIFEVTEAAPEAVNVCMVSVDSIYNVNRVVWEKPISTDIDHFKIYRESSQAGLYYHIGDVDYDSLSVYVDYVANPMVQSWRYKIASVNSCGTTSALSPAHKTIHLNQNIGLIANTVNLIWDHYQGFNYSTYDIVRYTASTGYTTLASISALNNSYTDAAAPLSDTTLFYVITANPADPCIATRAQNNGTTRSNRSQNAVAAPGTTEVSEAQTQVVNHFNLYPNPNNGFFTLEMEVKETGDFTIDIVDMFGKTVQSMHTGSTGTFYKKEMDLTSLSTGIYFVRIGNSNGYFMHKVIKN